MAPSVSLYFLGFLVLVSEAIALSRNLSDRKEDGIVMAEEELVGLFEVLGDLLDDPEWAQMHPQPCTDTPWPGVQCEMGELDPPTFHVTNINIGPDIVTPACKNSATLSNSLHKLAFLKALSIFNCFVTSPVKLAPMSFGALSSLEHLALESNPALTGEIPSSLAEIASLRVLILSQNNFQGNIPFEIGSLVNMEKLDLSYNNLSGQIPKGIGGLKSLSILDLSWNSLEGQIPCSLGQLQLLQKIDLGSNKLHGTIPPEFGKLKRLVLLDLSHNFVNGPMPVTLSGLEHLQYLIVDHNPVNSVVPMFLGTLSRLTSVSFSGCGLTGPIPNSISLLKNLASLSLDNNSLIGTVPTSLGSLPNLDHLNLSHNQLRGELILAEEFIDRLGKSLDVRGNSGLCTNNKIYHRKNISVYLETPTCLEAAGIGNSNRTCPNEKGNSNICGKENSGKFKGMQPYQDRTSSSASPCNCKHRSKLKSESMVHVLFVVFWLSFLL